MTIKSYQDLEVWQRGMTLAEMAYALTKSFPKEELFGMTSQIRRAAASIPANIAEGWGRDTTGEFLQFLRIAQGSLRELETHLLLSQRVQLTSQESITPLMELCQILGRQLIALQRSLQPKPTP
ncbi:MAG: four helix bundle protein [Candidatus Sumerlaeota bacterium]|nr:four helix bundle protein [Candidatus Sumerlaeota bacterium]